MSTTTKLKLLQPAFPIADWNNHPGPIGLTKRELFAAMAMQSVIRQSPDCTIPEVAYDAVRYADALIAELDK